MAIQDPRCPLLESMLAIEPLGVRVVVSALDEARCFDDQKAVANYGALTSTDVSEWGGGLADHVLP